MHAFLQFIENLAFSQWVQNAPTIWAFPTILVLHTIGMGIVAGGSSMLSFMILGFWPATVPMRPFVRVFPYMWAAFWLNAVTGTMMLMADATTKLTMPDFYVKMSCVFVGIYLLIRMRRDVFEDPQLDQAPVSSNAKMLAWASLACWWGAILAGRLMAYVK